MAIGNKNTGDQIGNDDIRTDNDLVASNEAKRLTSIESIWSNPNAGSTACGRTQTYPAGDRIIKYPNYVGQTTNAPTGTGEAYRHHEWSTVANPGGGDVIEAEHTAGATYITNRFVDKLGTVFGLTPEPGYYDTTFAIKGEVIPKEDVNRLREQWASITTALDIKDSWYSNNLCARSCQVSCQTACQTSCQGCNAGQCHNQKCGAH